MAGLMNRLAARALGMTPLAEPVIPARFTPESHLAAGHSLDPDTGPSHEHRKHTAAHPESFSRPAESTWDKPESVVRPQAPLAPAQPELSEPMRSHAAMPVITQDAEPIVFPPRQRHLSDVEALSDSLFPDRSSVRTPTLNDLLRDPELTPRTAIEEFGKPASRIHHTSPHEQAQNTTGESVHMASSQTSAQPVVQVTIGRIDVRAEISSLPPASTRTRPKPSTLSLNQFLKQRGTESQ